MSETKRIGSDDADERGLPICRSGVHLKGTPADAFPSPQSQSWFYSAESDLRIAVRDGRRRPITSLDLLERLDQVATFRFCKPCQALLPPSHFATWGAAELKILCTPLQAVYPPEDR